MDQSVSKEESYAERRKLFKNIWETSMHVDEKDDIMSKPKIIKTLQLDEMDRYTAGKKKKQRIKNLRAVCNKLLDFCDRQDADDLFYEQMASQGKEPQTNVIKPKIKKKHINVRKNVGKVKSLLPNANIMTMTRTTTCEVKNDVKFDAKSSRKTSPIKIKRKSLILETKRSMKTKQSLKGSLKSDLLHVTNTLQRKVIKKKRNKRKQLQIITKQPETNHEMVKL